MQKEIVLAILREAELLKKNFEHLEPDQHLSSADAEEMLQHVERLYRNLCVYTHSLKNKETSSDLDVHLKIMQTMSEMEANANKKTDLQPLPKEEEELAELHEGETHILRKIELNLNDKFRVINGLFDESLQEFQAALQQLNSINTVSEANRYLESLKQVYNWKDENQLVKNFYAQVQRRFA